MHLPYPPKPEESLTQCLGFGLPKRIKKQPVFLRRTPLSPIGKKKLTRLKNEGSEVDMYREIWNSRSKVCTICGVHIFNAFVHDGKGEKLAKPYVFAHKLAKGLFPKWRLVPENIDLVCSFDCHKKVDEKYQLVIVRVEFEKELRLIVDSVQ